MVYKIIKYIRSFLRKIVLKAVFKNRLNINIHLSNKKVSFIGKNVKFDINKNYKITIDNGVYISDYCKLQCISGNIKIGENVFFNDGCHLIALSGIEIGKNSMFGPNVGIYDHNHGYGDKSLPINMQGYKTENIAIGEDVWIGANVVITKGVKIGDRVIVGANSVVLGNLDSNSMYAGVPAKFIKSI